MKIGYPAKGVYGDTKFQLSPNFAHNGLMGVFDTQTGNVDIVHKSKLKNSLTETLKGLEIEVIITPQLQAMALKVFQERGMEVYKACSDDLSANIEQLKKHELAPYSFGELAQQSQSCSSSCSSCSTTDCSTN